MWTARQSGLEQQRSAADHRSPYERDRTRLIHSAAFRRLQRKTQIFGAQEGDFHRTRLTHSLEVDSIARSLVKNLQVQCQQINLANKLSAETNAVLLSLLPPDDLITAIALSHDIGHPPFGHGGESALNYMMRNHGGFESNGQTLRLLTKLETSYNPFGLDLTRRTLLGILKYPAAYSALVKSSEPPKKSAGNAQKNLINTHIPVNINHWIPPKGYLDQEQPEIDWILSPLSPEDKKLFQSYLPEANKNSHKKTIYHSLDCSIMNIADDIAYGVHDLEDAIHLKLITREHMDEKTLIPLFLAAFPEGTSTVSHAEEFLDKLFHVDAAQRKQAIGDMVNGFITAVFLKVIHPDFSEPLLRYNADLPKNIYNLLEHFKTVVLEHVINSPDGRITEHGGQQVICKLFEAISSNPTQLLNLQYRKSYQNASSESTQARVICDYIASMTDEHAYRLNKRLCGFLPL